MFVRRMNIDPYIRIRFILQEIKFDRLRSLLRHCTTCS